MEVSSICQGRQTSFAFSTADSGHITFEGIAMELNGKREIAIDRAKNEVNNKQATEKDVKKAVDKLNKFMRDKDTHVEYELYGRFKDLTIRIIDNKTKEVLKEIPPRKIIDMVDKLCELAGVFMDKKA